MKITRMLIAGLYMAGVSLAVQAAIGSGNIVSYDTTYNSDTGALLVPCVRVEHPVGGPPSEFYKVDFIHIPAFNLFRINAATTIEPPIVCNALFDVASGVYTDSFPFDEDQVEINLAFLSGLDFTIQDVTFKTAQIDDVEVSEGGFVDIQIPDRIDLSSAQFSHDSVPGLPSFIELIGRSLEINPPVGSMSNYAISIKWGNYVEEFVVQVRSNSQRLSGLNFSIYTGPQDPNKGSFISEEQIQENLLLAESYTDCIRTFGTSNGLAAIPRIAKDIGLCVAAGAWLSADLSANASEIDRLISIGQAGHADILLVGSENMLRGDITEAQLIDYINQVKEAVPNLPVASGAVYSTWLSHPSLVAAVDILFSNIYGYWEGIAADDAIAALHQNFNAVVTIANGKEVILGEVGYPSCGQTIGNAVPSPENSAFYFKNFISWAEAIKVRYFYFSMKDEPWKSSYGEGLAGPCWGIWTDELIMKPGMLEVFEGARVADNWTVSDGGGDVGDGTGDPQLIFTTLPSIGSHENLVGRVLNLDVSDHSVVVYITVNGRIWVKPTAANHLSQIGNNGTFVTDITTGGVDSSAQIVSAFVVPDTYRPPILLGATAFPQELHDNSVLELSVDRTAVDDPADNPTDDPADDPTDDPADDPTDDPAGDPTDDPVDDPTDDPAGDPTDDPVDDSTDYPLVPGPIVFGDTVADTINGGIHSYSMTGTAGDNVLVRMSGLSPSLDPTFRVYRPDGSVICEASRTSRGLLEQVCLLDVTGTFSILISDDDGLNVGAYNLAIQRLNGPAQTTSISIGDTVADTINGGIHSYSMTGTAGDKVLVRMSGLSPSLDPTFRVYRPDGSVICEASRTSRGLLEQVCLLDVTGTFSILISDDDGLNVGAYNLAIQRLNGPAQTTSISIGDTVADTINGGIHSYSMTGTAGDKVLVRMSGLSPSLDPTFRVYRPDGSVICEASRTSRGLLEQVCLLDVTGTFSILISDDDGLNVGAYNLAIQRLNGPAQTTSISIGDTVADTINGGIHSYSMTGTAGDKVLVRMSGLSPSLDPTFRVYRPDGSVICEASRTSRGLLEQVCLLDVTGTFSILISDDDGLNVGAYNLNLERQL